MSTALQASGVRVLEHAGTIERFEPSPAGVRLVYSGSDAQDNVDATLAVVAVGWVANTDGLDLAAAGVETDPAVTSRWTPSSARPRRASTPPETSPGTSWSSTRPRARPTSPRPTPPSAAPTPFPRRSARSAASPTPNTPLSGSPRRPPARPMTSSSGPRRFDSLPRPIIDGRPTGFCKLVVDREHHTILGCHIVGERAVELAQLAALAVASGMKVEQLALVPFSFPTYANALGRAAVRAAAPARLSEPMNASLVVKSAAPGARGAAGRAAHSSRRTLGGSWSKRCTVVADPRRALRCSTRRLRLRRPTR